MPQPHRPTFNNTVAKILKIILELKGRGLPARGKDIAEQAGRTDHWVREVLTHLEGDFLKVERIPSEGGRAAMIFDLDANKIITRPLTAWLLLQLFEEAKKGDIEINRAEFESIVADKLRRLRYPEEQLEKDIKERLSFLIDTKYVGAGSRAIDVIWLENTKFFVQRPFIELLADDFKKRFPRADKQQEETPRQDIQPQTPASRRPQKK